jgi:PAS domain S-box-containing protein
MDYYSPAVGNFSRQAGDWVLDEFPLGIWVARAPTGEVLYTNRSFKTIMGMEAVSGADITSAPAAYGIFDRRGNPYLVEDLPFSQALVRGKAVVVDDLVIHRRDGNRVCLRAFANPVRDAQGVVSHVVIAFTDITAEVRAMAERAEIERHLEVAIHHAPVLLFTLDQAGVVTAADGALRAILASDNAGIVGVSLFEAYKDDPIVVSNVRRALAGETVSYTVEVRQVTLDVWIGPVWDAAGNLTGAMGVCTDVTEARRLQARIIQDDRIRAIGTVAASVAHEINNPLTYVLAGLEEATLEIESLSTQIEALTHGRDDELVATTLRTLGRLKERLDPVLAGTNRIRDVTRELKTFTRPDNERLTQIDLPVVVRSVLSLVRREIEARAHLIEEINPSPRVLGNEARLVQVLTNLLINAWQALPEPDPIRHVIGVRTGSRDGDALIEIWDSGTGVPAHLREQVFEPFVTTKDIGTGTGLGLFVCRNVVNALRGQISVHDAPGGGALFRVVLPAATADASGPTPPIAVEVAAEPKTHPRRILIIDDDAMVAHALAACLPENVFEVRAVLDSRQGLDILLADDRLDLAYCDLMMKTFTGIDLYEALRQKAPHRLSKVVFMTGGAFTSEARAFLEKKGDVFVQKPFDILADACRRMGLPASVIHRVR